MLKDYIEQKPTIKTEHLLLRNMTADDTDDLREWLGLPQIYELGKESNKRRA